MADPEKLLRSAARLYGDDMDRLWGDTLPVPRENLRVLGEEDDLGGFHSLYTPGHASHHVTYFHEPSRTAFTGDVAGVRIGGGPVMAPTPPPDVDLEAWERSLQAIERLRPAALAPTHFGIHSDVGAQLAALRAYLDEWGPRARELDCDAWIAEWREKVASTGESVANQQAMPADQQWAGLDRYWRRGS
jgi:glyoxylase-like metal-dependent hydrolase (beta-lactamase superfamily II)